MADITGLYMSAIERHLQGERTISIDEMTGIQGKHPGFANMQKYDIFVKFFKLPTRTLPKNLFEGQ